MVELRVNTQKIVTMKFELWAIVADHSYMVEHDSNSPKMCRWNFALRRVLPGVTKPEVDAGHIKFTLNGWRWCAETPKKIKGDLLKLDRWLRLPKKVRAETPIPYEPGRFVIKAVRGKQSRKATPEEIARIVERRKQRMAEAAARGDKVVKPKRSQTFHNRVVGFAS